MLYIRNKNNSRYFSYSEGDGGRTVLVYDDEDLTVEKVHIRDIFKAVRNGIEFDEVTLKHYRDKEVLVRRSLDYGYKSIDRPDVFFSYRESDYDERIAEIIVDDSYFEFYKVTHLAINNKCVELRGIKGYKLEVPKFFARYGTDYIIVDCGICLLINIHNGDISPLAYGKGLGITSDIEGVIQSQKDSIYHRGNTAMIKKITPMDYKKSKLFGDGLRFYSQEEAMNKKLKEGKDLAAYFRNRYSG